MNDKEQNDIIKTGEDSYQRWHEGLAQNPDYLVVYEEEAAKSELWLQLVEARQEAGLTQKQLAKRLGVSQAQVARLEQEGYDAYTLNTLRRYVSALGNEFELEVKIIRREPGKAAEHLHL